MTQPAVRGEALAPKIPDTEAPGTGESPTMTVGLDPHGPGNGVFDDHHPPSDELISDCVHCGFCLPTCPTYALWGEEMDSPRGRIYLMKAGKDGRAEMDETFVSHFDACLGCLACVTACPSGVQYDALIESVRPQIERNYKRSLGERIFRAFIFALFPYPARLRPAAFFGALYQALGIRALLSSIGLIKLLPSRLRAMEALLPPMKVSHVVSRNAAVTPAVGTRRARVGFLTGCVQRVFFGDVNEAAIRVLAAEGCEVVAPREQRCCGALSEHAGREEEALRFARGVIDTFLAADVEHVVVTVAGCGSTMKHYARLLADDPVYGPRAAEFAAKVRDVSEILAQLGPVAERHPIPSKVAYHDACHLAHGQGIRAEPRTVLRGIPQMQVTDIPEAEICCGSAGIYNLVQPEPAEELGHRKVRNIEAVSPDAVATANPGCLLQIRRYLDSGVPLFHPVELVDASIRGVDPVQQRRPAGQRGRQLDARTSEPGRF